MLWGSPWALCHPTCSPFQRSSAASLPCVGSTAQLSHKTELAGPRVMFTVCAAAHEALVRPRQGWQELPVRAACAGRAAVSEQAEVHMQVMGEQ